MLEKIESKEVWHGVQRAVRQDVLNCGVQLARLAPKCPQREEAQMRLRLALLRQEGVKIAMKAITTERVGIEKAGQKAEADAAPDVKLIQDILNAPTTPDDYRRVHGKNQIQAARQPCEDWLCEETANLVRTAHYNLMEEARKWRVETANEQIQELAKLLVN